MHLDTAAAQVALSRSLGFNYTETTLLLCNAKAAGSSSAPEICSSPGKTGWQCESVLGHKTKQLQLAALCT